MRIDAPITTITPGTFRLPTPEPESDGTLTWEATTAVTARLEPLLVTGLPPVVDSVLRLSDQPGHGKALRPDVDRHTA